MRAVPLLFLLAACAAREDEDTYAGTIEFPDTAVGSLVGGRILEVSRQEGEHAAAGDPLVILDPKEWRSALDEAEALAKATARELDLLLAGPRKEEIEQARAEARRLELMWKVVAEGAREEEIEQAREDVKAAAALLGEADTELERERTLVRQGSSTTERLDQAVTKRETARARKAAAEQRLQLLERGSRPEEVEAARMAYIAQQEVVKRLEAGARPEEIAAKRATLDAAHARSRVAQSKLEELTIRAPADCFVQTLDLRQGDLLQPGQPVAVLLLSGEPWVTIYVPESDLARIVPGQAAEIVPDGHPPLQGRVAWVSRRAEYTPRNVQTRKERTTQVFRVKVTLEGDVSRLKDGMWADVRLK